MTRAGAIAYADWILPDWPAPPSVRAVQTTRSGGVSVPPYDSFNLSPNVGDDARAVDANRAALRDHAGLPAEPVWLHQVHGTTVVSAHGEGLPREADAAWTNRPGVVCAVMTADCLPVLLCDRRGEEVAVAHAGWRGLAAGVLERTLGELSAPATDLMAWLGPAIGPDAYEVGGEVRERFLQLDAGASACFSAGRPGHWYADLYCLARRRLHGLGVRDIKGGGYCTHGDPQRFYSHRRDGPKSGRMATLIWLSTE